MRIHTQVVIGLVLGTLAGVLLGPRAALFEPLGDLFLRLIRMVIVPLIAATLISAIAGISGRRVLGRMGARALGFVMLSLAVALVGSIFIGSVLRPGAVLDSATRDALIRADTVPDVEPDAPRPTLSQTLIQIVPSNLVGSAVNGNVLQVLFVSLLVGLAAAALSDAKRKPLVDVATSLAEVMFKLVEWIMKLAPFGVFGILAGVVGRSGLSVLVSLAWYVGVVLLALALHIVLFYGFVLVGMSRASPSRFFKSAREPTLIAFATCSTAAALPVSIKSMRDHMGISSRVASFVLPLGASIGRDGSAMYQVISVLFVAQVYGKALGASDYTTLMVIAMLSSLAVAPVPAASFVNLTIILTALGLPLEGAAIVFGVERPLDMLRSSTNLIGQLVNATYVGSAEHEIADPGISPPAPEIRLT